MKARRRRAPSQSHVSCTMRNVIWTASLLLCCLNGGSVSGRTVQYVAVRPGEDVKLLCSNFSSVPAQIIWLRVTDRPSVHCIVSVYEAHGDTEHCGGSPREKFVMSSNMSVVFLTIKAVNESDSGLYFCGYYIQRNPVIIDATHLDVHASGMLKYLSSGILSAVTLLLLVGIIHLAVKNKKLQKGRAESYKNPQDQRRSSDHLDYAAVTFHPNTEQDRRPSPHRETDADVIYSSPRQTAEAPEAAGLMRN